MTFAAAIQALKRKKRFEKQLQQIDGTLSTIEMQREALEGANTNTAVLTNMKSAADALKAAHQHMYVSIPQKKCTTRSVELLINFLFVIFFPSKQCRDVDQVHDMMDDIAEQQDVAKEISDAISNPVAFGKHNLLLSFSFFIFPKFGFQISHAICIFSAIDRSRLR